MFKSLVFMSVCLLLVILLALGTRYLAPEEIVMSDLTTNHPVGLSASLDGIIEMEEVSVTASRHSVQKVDYLPVVKPADPVKHYSERFHRNQAGMARIGKPVYPLVAEGYVSNTRENYIGYQRNGVRLVADKPVSTFSIDVDTGAYSNLRRFLNMGSLPAPDVIRVEEMINYFDYHYPIPASGEAPFAIATELSPSPWNDNKQLLRIGLKGYEVSKRLPANLVFLIDVSGSMNQPNKLPLVQSSINLLVNQLAADDLVSIVTYAGQASVALEPTNMKDALLIRRAIENLSAGGSTYGEGGLREAYRLARSNFREGGINRVILATDGDFNVGTDTVQGMKTFIERQRHSGIGLTALGYGMGNYNDAMLEQLADAGNGNHAYIDTLSEAQRVLVKQLTSTLQTIASDVKIQVEFNPAVVAEYRLVGYENRMLAREDFNNDKVDAGEIGAGHTVTALYEVTLVGSPAVTIDPLRYDNSQAPAQSLVTGSLELASFVKNRGDELALLKLRYKNPGEQKSHLFSQIVMLDDRQEEASDDTRFAAAVAGFGQLLRGGKYIDSNFQQILIQAQESAGNNASRLEFVSLVELAMAIQLPQLSSY